MEEETQRGEDDNQKQVLKVLEALKQVSQDLKNKPTENPNSNPIKALLELETEGDTTLSKDPNLQNLSDHLTKLKQVVIDNLPNSHGHGIRSFIRRRVTNHEISKLAESIETEIQAWIDRESVENLVRVVKNEDADEDEKVKLLTQFENRVLEGFNRDLQDLVLKFKVFNVLETLLCNSKNSIKLKEASAFAVGGLVQFNKDVFVGEVLMGPIIPALISMGSTSTCSIQVLCSLIRSIKSPLVDEIESNGQIPKIIKLLGLENEPSIRVTALDCVLEIGYFGRKEAVDAMLAEGLVKRLVELQRSELGGSLIDLGPFDGDEKETKTSRDNREKEYLEEHPFVSCVHRFWIQLDVGEGLRQREKRAFKLEILQRVREACDSDSEAATVLAEVLWGSSL